MRKVSLACASLMAVTMVGTSTPAPAAAVAAGQRTVSDPKRDAKKAFDITQISVKRTKSTVTMRVRVRSLSKDAGAGFSILGDYEVYDQYAYENVAAQTWISDKGKVRTRMLAGEDQMASPCRALKARWSEKKNRVTISSPVKCGHGEWAGKLFSAGSWDVEEGSYPAIDTVKRFKLRT